MPETWDETGLSPTPASFCPWRNLWLDSEFLVPVSVSQTSFLTLQKSPLFEERARHRFALPVPPPTHTHFHFRMFKVQKQQPVPGGGWNFLQHLVLRSCLSDT